MTTHNDYLPQELFDYAKERMTREERKDVIYSILSGYPWAIPLRILASAMGVTKSPYLWNLVNELIEDGYVGRDVGTTIQGNTVYLFYAVVDGDE